MRDENEARVWTVTGAVGAMVLGIVLITLRTLTAAANLAFVFGAFTIIVAAASILALEVSRRRNG
jgi:hypothetical protein